MASENIEYNQSITRIADYAVTITFKHLHCKSPKGMFKETSPYLTKLLARSTTFSLVAEFRAETGDIHYHGVIRIKDFIKWHRDTLPNLKRLGFICIKKIGGKSCKFMKKSYEEIYDGWVKYYTKEIDVARGLLGDYFPLVGEISFKKKDIKINDVMDNYILNDSAQEDDEKRTEQVKETSR